MQRITERRLQDLNGTLYISVPIEWARMHGLEKGSLVDLYSENNWLVLVPPPKETS